MNGTARHQLRNLPRGYFADAQDHHFASPSTDNRLHGTGVPGADRETERTEESSPAGDTPPGGMDTRPALGVEVEVVRVAGGGERSHAAGNQFRERAGLPSAGTTASSRPALDPYHLHAARFIPGRAAS